MRSTLLFTSLLLAFTVFNHAAQGQASVKIDSLAIKLSQHTTQDSTRVDILNQIGFEYWTIDPVQSERNGFDALKLAEQLNYKSGLAMAHRVIGVSYWSRGDFYRALVHLFKSQEIYKEINDSLGEGNAMMNIGLVYAEHKDYGRALENFLRAIQIFEKLKREDRIATTYNKIGSVYLEKGELDKAEEYLRKGLDIHTQNNFSFGIMEANNRIGLLYREKGDLKNAELYLQLSLDLAIQNKDHEHLAKNMENLASVNIILGRLDKAETLLDQALPIAREKQYKKWLRDIYKDYRDIYLQKKNFAKAFEYAELYESIKDSIFGEEKAAQIANLELEHQTAEQRQAIKLKENEIRLLQEQARFDRLLKVSLISAMILLLIIVYILFYYQRFRYKKNQELLERSHQLAEKELENARLKEIDLQHELEFKNKELTSYTVNFIRKNELIDELRERLQELKLRLPEPPRELNSLLNLVQQNNHIDKDWDDFKRAFENVHHNFYGALLAEYPDLTQSELRLCSLVCLNLSIKEVSSLMGISPDSVKTARYRLRKRLNLIPEQNLDEFIIKFSHQNAVKR